jgi:hypothetical protein
MPVYQDEIQLRARSRKQHNPLYSFGRKTGIPEGCVSETRPVEFRISCRDGRQHLVTDKARDRKGNRELTCHV